MVRSRSRPWIEWGLVGAAVALAAYRFVDLGQAPFINDEAIFLDAARAQLLTGHWASANPIAGTNGNYYGPSVMWFYGAVQWLLGARALTSIAAMCFLVTAAQVLLCLAVAGCFARTPEGERGLFKAALLTSKGRWIFGASLLFLASSPHQFFWSRLAWDQLTLAVPCLVVALLCGERLGAGRCLAIGALLGFGFSSHPMITVFCALVGLAIFVELVRTPKQLWVIGPLLAGAIAVNVPYFLFLRGRGAPQTAAGPFDLSFDRLLDTFRPATLWRIEYFFDGDWEQFTRWTALASSAVAIACLATVVALTLFGLAVGLKGADRPRRRILLLAAASLVAYPLFFAWRGLVAHPHYQFPNGWLTPVALAAGLGFAFERRHARTALFGVTFALALVQTLFIIRWNGFIADRGGTRGMHYSVPVGRTREVVGELCASAAPAAVVLNATLILPKPLEYHALTDPSCEGKTVVVCAPFGGCTATPPPGAAEYQLQYASATGGAVRLQKLAPP